MRTHSQRNISQGPQFCTLQPLLVYQESHPTLYQINGPYVAFMRLTTNVKTTWQTTIDDFVDVSLGKREGGWDKAGLAFPCTACTIAQMCWLQGGSVGVQNRSFFFEPVTILVLHDAFVDAHQKHHFVAVGLPCSSQ